MVKKQTKPECSKLGSTPPPARGRELQRPATFSVLPWTRPSLHVCTSELQTEPSLPIIRGEIGRNKHWKHFIVRGLYSRVLLWELCPRRVDLEMVKGNLQVIHYIIILCFTLCIELLYSCGSNPWYLLSSGTIIIFLIASLSYLPCSHFTRACLFCRINEGRKKLNSK